MAKNKNNVNQLKINMDVYTRELYEDFIGSLSERLRGIADTTRTKLDQLSRDLNKLKEASGKAANEQRLQTESLQKQINDVLLDYETTLINEMKITVDTYDVALKEYLAKTQKDAAKHFDALNTKIETVPNIFDENLNTSLNSYAQQIDMKIKTNIQKNSQSLIGEIKTLAHSEIEKYSGSILENIQNTNRAISTFEENMSKGLVEGKNQLVVSIQESIQGLNSEMTKLHQEINIKNDVIEQQIQINQELLIWILTPWYKKLFRRKNGKPQILVKKPITEP